ncbi:hypothetical protein ROHU_012959 [Labeo rohita]|uniref:Uncharacterized protein n=1 Tax=Labeo rohita TaxID=84645 RepID=A0A498L8L7_LABRO|nr:hypothetical protein ROHU_012959 [Labeo rohita]
MYREKSLMKSHEPGEQEHYEEAVYAILSRRATALQCVDNNGACDSVTDSTVDNERFAVVNYLGWKHNAGYF